MKLRLKKHLTELICVYLFVSIALTLSSLPYNRTPPPDPAPAPKPEFEYTKARQTTRVLSQDDISLFLPSLAPSAARLGPLPLVVSADLSSATVATPQTAQKTPGCIVYYGSNSLAAATASFDALTTPATTETLPAPVIIGWSQDAAAAAAALPLLPGFASKCDLTYFVSTERYSTTGSGTVYLAAGAGAGAARAPPHAAVQGADGDPVANNRLLVRMQREIAGSALLLEVQSPAAAAAAATAVSHAAASAPSPLEIMKYIQNITLWQYLKNPGLFIVPGRMLWHPVVLSLIGILTSCVQAVHANVSIITITSITPCLFFGLAFVASYAPPQLHELASVLILLVAAVVAPISIAAGRSVANPTSRGSVAGAVALSCSLWGLCLALTGTPATGTAAGVLLMAGVGVPMAGAASLGGIVAAPVTVAVLVWASLPLGHTIGVAGVFGAAGVASLVLGAGLCAGSYMAVCQKPPAKVRKIVMKNKTRKQDDKVTVPIQYVVCASISIIIICLICCLPGWRPRPSAPFRPISESSTRPDNCVVCADFPSGPVSPALCSLPSALCGALPPAPARRCYLEHGGQAVWTVPGVAETVLCTDKF